MEDKNVQQVLTLAEEKENVCMALIVHFRIRACVPVSFVCHQVNRWPVKSDSMAK